MTKNLKINTHGITTNRYLFLLVDLLTIKSPNNPVIIQQLKFLLEVPFVSIAKFEELFHNVLTSMNEPDLGLQFGQILDLSTHERLGQAMMTSPTFEDVVKTAMKYIKTRSILFEVNFENETEWGIITAKSCFSDTVENFLIDALFACIHTIRKFLLGPSLETQILLDRDIQQKRPYEEFFDGVVHSHTSNQYRFPVQDLQIQLKSANPAVHQIAIKQCSESFNTHVHPDITMALTNLFTLSLFDYSDMEKAARQLNLSMRTLRRKLAEKNTTFRDLLEKFRTDKAIAYLSHTNLSIAEIGYRLNYNDPSNFGSAFKRNMGQSPSQFRSGLRGNVSPGDPNIKRPIIGSAY